MDYRYRTDEEMKDSGIEGSGKIPKGWKVSKWGYVTKILTDYTANGSFGDLAKNVKYLDYPDYARLVRLVDLREELNNTGVYVTKEAYDYLGKSSLYGDEFLIANVGANSGFVCTMPNVDYPCTLAPNMMMARFYDNIVDNNFMIYSANSYGVKMQLLSKATQSSAQPKLNKDDFRTTQFIMPELKVQQQIVAFLNKKTAQFDSIISKKEALIEKLEEGKKSLISEVVTGKVKVVKTNDGYELVERKKEEMKDSGVEWVKLIPNEWNLKRSNYVFKFSKGLSITKENLQDEGIPCINYGEIHSKYGFEVNPQKHKLKCVAKEYLNRGPNALIKYGDFIFADTSEDIKGCGNFSYLNAEDSIFAGYHTVIARPIEKVSSRFLAYLFDSDDWRIQIRTKVSGIKVFSITQSILKSTKVILPTLSEQDIIVNYIDDKFISINLMINNMKLQIEKLKEAKQSLISEAVTGKIEILD